MKDLLFRCLRINGGYGKLMFFLGCVVFFMVSYFYLCYRNIIIDFKEFVLGSYLILYKLIFLRFFVEIF